LFSPNQEDDMRALGNRVLSVGIWAAGVAGLAAFGPAPARAAADPPKEKQWRLEFRLLAHKQDDADAFDAAAKALTDPKRKDELKKLAEEGKPPPAPETPADKGPGYAWVAVGPAELRSLKLDDESKEFTKQAAKAREAGEPLVTPPFDNLLFSRVCQNTQLTREEREAKKYDFFLLTRLPEKGKALTGEFLTEAKAAKDSVERPSVEFALNDEGAKRLKDVSSRNLKRPLAIIIDGRVVSAPRIVDALGARGAITGDFTDKDVDALLEALRSDLPKKDK
jgi:hypothetical protein